MLDWAKVTVSPAFTVLDALNAPNQRRTGVVMVNTVEEPVVPVKATANTAVVELVTEAIVVKPPGMPVAAILWPTSAEVKFPVAEEMFADRLVTTPSAEVTRVAESHNSMLLIVQAGMTLKLTVPGEAELVIEPALAVPQIVVVVVS